MRISTKLATGLMGVGVLAVSFKLGLPSPVVSAPTAGSTETSSPATTPAPSTAPSATTPSATKPTKAPSSSGGTTTSKQKPTKTPSSGGTTTPPNTNPGTGGGTVTPASVTKTGDVIYYQFGAIQLSVTEDASGTITAINTLQAGATGGRQGAFSSLKASALSAQGSSFGNVSRATYTSMAFKDALDSALAKF